MRLVFFLLAIANAFLVWRHFDELMLIGSSAEAQESSEAIASIKPTPVQPLPKSDALDDSASANKLHADNSAQVQSEVDEARTEIDDDTGSQPFAANNSLPVNDLPRQCYWAGPLNADEPSGNALIERLKALRISVSDHRVRTAGPDRFWVIIPRDGLTQGATSVIASLKKAKIDSYEIGRGEHAGAVSLGFYSREALAHARVEKAARLGWLSEIVHVATSAHQQWLQVDKQQADAVGEGILARMVKNNSGVEIIEKKCELPVASHNNIH